MAMLAVACAPAARAATLTWSATGTSSDIGGTGTWDTSALRWTANGSTWSAWNNAGIDTAVFAGTAGTVTLNTGITVGGLTFSTTGYTVTGNTLTLAGATAVMTATTGITAEIASNVSGTAVLQKSGSGTLKLSGSNSHSRGTTLSAGRLDLNHSYALGTGTLTISGSGTLGNSSGGTVTLATNNPQAWNADFSFVGPNNLNLGTGAVTTNGARTIGVTQGRLTVGGPVTATAGALVKTGSGSLEFAGGAALAGSSNINGGTVLVTGGTFGATTGSINLNVGSAAGAVGPGAFRQSAGLVTFGTGAPQYVVGQGSTYGYYELSSGTLQVAFGGSGAIRIGPRTGAWYQSGGSFTLDYGGAALSGSQPFAISDSGNGGVVYATGGTTSILNATASSVSMLLSNGGAASQLTIASSADWTNGSLLNANNGPGYINLNNGGRLTTGSFFGINGRLNFDGGTLRPVANASDFISGLNSAQINAGGATIDTNGKNITIGQAFLAPSGNGLTTIPVTAGGSGYIGPPVVSISGGGGSDATAVANWDPATGSITSITITNPGRNYTSAPTVTLVTSNFTPTSAATVGTATFGAITSGGLTKSGSGTLTLTGASTYTGTTTLSGGVLNVGSAETAGTSGPLGKSAASNPGSIVLAGGTLQYSGSNTNDYSGRFSTAANQQYNVDTNGQNVSWATALSSSGGSLTKSGSGTLTLGATNTYTGATTIAAGILSFSSTNRLQGTSGVTIAGGAGLTYTGGADTFAKNVTVTPGSGTGTIRNTGGGTLTLSGTLSKDNSVLRLSGGSFNVTGLITGTTVGTSDLIVAGTSSVTLSNTNTYNGPTFVIESSTLSLGINNAIPNSSAVTLGDATTVGTLQLAGFTDAIGGLAFGTGGGTLRLAATSTTAAPLTALTGTMTLTNGTLDLAGSGSTAGLYRVLAAQSIAGSFASVTGTSAAYQVVTTSTTVDYQQRAVLGTVTVTNPAVSIITGGSAAFTYTVANTALSGGATLSYTGTGLSNVNGVSSGSAAAAGTSGATSGMVFTGTSLGSSQGTFTVSAPSAFGSTSATGTVTVNVLDHSNAAFSLSGGNNQTIITGGSLGSVTFGLTNAGSNRSALDVSTLSNLTGTTGSAVVASNGSATYTATGFNTVAVGQNKTLVVSLSAGDQQTLSGASALQTYSGTATYTVLDHSNAALSLASGGGQTIITGGSFATVGFNLTNAGANRAAVQVDSLTNLTGGTGSAVVLSGGTAGYTSTIVDTITVGTGTLSVGMLAGDQQSLSGASALQNRTATATYTILDHAQSSLGASLLTSTTISLGTWNTVSQTWESGTNSALFSIFNIASPFGAGFTANLALLGVTGTANGFTTNLGTYANIAGGASSAFSVSFDPTGFDSAGEQSTTFVLSTSDDTGLSGATASNTLYLTASVTIVSVPEPAAIVLAGVGLAVATWSANRRRRRTT